MLITGCNRGIDLSTLRLLAKHGAKSKLWLEIYQIPSNRRLIAYANYTMFLASDKSEYKNGEIIVCNGGRKIL